jgi:PTH1 family peptidyl-tRNA hydrolase
VGLGNPGEVYAATRHNLGFRVVEALAQRRGIRFEREDCSARVAAGGELLLAEPLTFMNRSGYAVRCLAERHGLAPEAVLIVYDDVALPLGTLRLRPRGGPGGHRGMESVIENLRSDAVARLRLGIAQEASPEVVGERDLSEFVLSAFEASELETVEGLVVRAAEGAELWLELGAEAAMNRING